MMAALNGSLSAEEAQLLPKIALQESASHFDLQREGTIQPPDEAEGPTNTIAEARGALE